jgi:hypothetical protein
MHSASVSLSWKATSPIKVAGKSTADSAQLSKISADMAEIRGPSLAEDQYGAEGASPNKVRKRQTRHG